MEEYLKAVRGCPLFAGIEGRELQALLTCLSAAKKRYEKHRFVFIEGDKVSRIGIVLSGGVRVIQEDFWGNRTILADVTKGGLFGEAFSCAGTEKLPVSVVAAEDSEILLIDYRKIITTCTSACAFHTGLINNMLSIIAGKNVMLTQKIEYLTRRTTRGKLLAYLSAQARRAGSDKFEIPFNRQELAEYLSVDRSAMSSELSRMSEDGILSFHKNKFELLKKEQY